MKTVHELRALLDSVPWASVSAHVHTHLCDGRPNMTVENIAAEAQRLGLGLVVLTPHFHKRVSDASETLYTDTDPGILTQLRDEIDAYRRRGGAIPFLLSTEADILSMQGELSLDPSPMVEKALDFITPTMNYHPLLPLHGVHLTYGRDIDRMHESGEYAAMAEAAGGVDKVLDAMYETQANALLRAPYPAMLGHFFAAHSVANDRYNWFGAEEAHLSRMQDGARKVLDACQRTGAMVDITGLHLHNETPAHKRQKDGFLYGFQRWFLDRCDEMQIAYYPGSDAHGLGGLSGSLCYGEIFEK